MTERPRSVMTSALLTAYLVMTSSIDLCVSVFVLCADRREP